MTSETFEQVLTLAQADGGLNPAFKKFLQTKFFVPIHKEPKADMQVSLHVSQDGLTISEVAERVQAGHGHSTISLAGADIVRHLQADADILIALSDRAFTIARDRVQWLRQVVDAAHAKAAAQKAAAAAPAAAPVAAPAPAPAPAVKPAPARRGGVLDIAALRPREISRADIGLSLFIPGAWTHTSNAKTTFATDPVGGTRIEISGAHRPNMSLTQWKTMRLSQVGYDQRFLQQAGESYALDGDDWRGRIKGTATEFTGIFPGEETESRFMVACFWTEGKVASITFRAHAEEFENNRSLYKWLISRVSLTLEAQPEVNVYGAPRADLSSLPAMNGVYCEPPIFGFSLDGRIGRLRAIAYCWPLGFSMLLTFWFATRMGNGVAVVVTIVLAGLASIWFSLRLTVLRLHDINRTGKWVLAFIGAWVVAAAVRNPGLSATVGVIGMLAMFVLYYIWPGAEGENDYGAPPAANTLWVYIGAWIVIIAQALAFIAPIFIMGYPMWKAMLMQ